MLAFLLKIHLNLTFNEKNLFDKIPGHVLQGREDTNDGVALCQGFFLFPLNSKRESLLLAVKSLWVNMFHFVQKTAKLVTKQT